MINISINISIAPFTIKLKQISVSLTDEGVLFCHFDFFAVLNSVIFYIYYDTNIMLISHYLYQLNIYFIS